MLGSTTIIGCRPIACCMCSQQHIVRKKDFVRKTALDTHNPFSSASKKLDLLSGMLQLFSCRHLRFVLYHRDWVRLLSRIFRCILIMGV